MIRRTLLLFIGLIIMPVMAWSFEVYRDGDISLGVGFWGQAWYQYVGSYERDADGYWNDDLHDFMVRRAYFNVQGTITPKLGFFVHYAGDRIGQDGLDNPSMGLGSGLAIRDAWLNYKLIKNDLMIQVGRMYIPFTRNYGTTSPKSLLTTELDWGQGGLRSGIFYPSKVGRDDSITFWGNVLDDKLQYRFMIGEGSESQTVNTGDSIRLAGRLSYNLFDPETSWFNSGTYLGKKKILAIGGGFDYQANLLINGQRDDYNAYTIDVHLDLPTDNIPITAETAYIKINHSVNGVTWSGLTAGEDGDILTAKIGILLAEKLQPFGHLDFVMPDASGTDDTTIFGLGWNYYIKGPTNKLTMEWSVVDYGVHTVDIVTFQAAFGF